jgi:hypothetical protein
MEDVPSVHSQRPVQRDDPKPEIVATGEFGEMVKPGDHDGGAIDETGTALMGHPESRSIDSVVLDPVV